MYQNFIKCHRKRASDYGILQITSVITVDLFPVLSSKQTPGNPPVNCESTNQINVSIPFQCASRCRPATPLVAHRADSPGQKYSIPSIFEFTQSSIFFSASRHPPATPARRSRSLQHQFDQTTMVKRQRAPAPKKQPGWCLRPKSSIPKEHRFRLTNRNNTSGYRGIEATLLFYFVVYFI